jgi:glycine dehydrogenase subunit 1
LREQAEQNLAKAHFALTELEKIPGVTRTFAGPFFNEFTVVLPKSVKLVNAELLKEKIVGPFVLGAAYPELSKNAVVCVTETTSRGEIERLVAGVRKALTVV